jgi:hypothetical protein
VSGNRSGRNRGCGIGRFKRALIIAAYEGRCWICGCKPNLLSLDHVVPRMDGGGIEIENLRPACPRCNVQRAARLGRMAGRARRHCIAKEVKDSWHRRYPLPRFNQDGQLEEIDLALWESLPPYLRNAGYAAPQLQERAA